MVMVLKLLYYLVRPICPKKVMITEALKHSKNLNYVRRLSRRVTDRLLRIDTIKTRKYFTLFSKYSLIVLFYSTNHCLGGCNCTFAFVKIRIRLHCSVLVI